MQTETADELSKLVNDLGAVISTGETIGLAGVGVGELEIRTRLAGAVGNLLRQLATIRDRIEALRAFESLTARRSIASAEMVEVAGLAASETRAYELAYAHRERCDGLAFLLRNAVNPQEPVEDEHLAGIGRLASDIAEDAARIFEAVRIETITARECSR
jgi:hypothetical protein